ncbi:MAG: hypothetical protein EZS28_003463 [Streblomastix strix]|uniref:C3H1-type domain-containing protein n=1 Tax=Streblomastix strix TaxID=222440 RepID=A0A5J4X2N8_9EUKA|nr:MAG: hypothetical protein EZS28_003463 [Streblomastix strix]
MSGVAAQFVAGESKETLGRLKKLLGLLPRDFERRITVLSILFETLNKALEQLHDFLNNLERSSQERLTADIKRLVDQITQEMEAPQLNKQNSEELQKFLSQSDTLLNLGENLKIAKQIIFDPSKKLPSFGSLFGYMNLAVLDAYTQWADIHLDTIRHTRAQFNIDEHPKETFVSEQSECNDNQNRSKSERRKRKKENNSQNQQQTPTLTPTQTPTFVLSDIEREKEKEKDDILSIREGIIRKEEIQQIALNLPAPPQTRSISQSPQLNLQNIQDNIHNSTSSQSHNQRNDKSQLNISNNAQYSPQTKIDRVMNPPTPTSQSSQSLSPFNVNNSQSSETTKKTRTPTPNPPKFGKPQTIQSNTRQNQQFNMSISANTTPKLQIIEAPKPNEIKKRNEDISMSANPGQNTQIQAQPKATNVLNSSVSQYAAYASSIAQPNTNKGDTSKSQKQNDSGDNKRSDSNNRSGNANMLNGSKRTSIKTSNGDISSSKITDKYGKSSKGNANGTDNEKENSRSKSTTSKNSKKKSEKKFKDDEDGIITQRTERPGIRSGSKSKDNEIDSDYEDEIPQSENEGRESNGDNNSGENSDGWEVAGKEKQEIKPVQKDGVVQASGVVGSTTASVSAERTQNPYPISVVSITNVQGQQLVPSNRQLNGQPVLAKYGRDNPPPQNMRFEGILLGNFSPETRRAWVACPVFPDNVFLDLRRVRQEQQQNIIMGAYCEFTVEVNVPNSSDFRVNQIRLSDQRGGAKNITKATKGICIFYTRQNWCKHGDKCNYAHITLAKEGFIPTKVDPYWNDQK